MPLDASESPIRRIAGAYRAKLGESPVWTEDGRLAFVDIVAKELLLVTAAKAKRRLAAEHRAGGLAGVTRFLFGRAQQLRADPHAAERVHGAVIENLSLIHI